MIRTEIKKRISGDYPRRAAIREYLASACETESKESKGPCSN